MKKIFLEFKDRGGLWFFSSSIIDKITRLSLSFFLLYILTKDEIGIWNTAIVFASTFIPIKSLGLESGILQFTSTLNDKEKDQLYKDIFFKGLSLALLVGLLSILSSLFLNADFEKSKHLLYILSGWLVSYYLFEMLLNYYRVIQKHKKYAQIQSIYNILFILLIPTSFYIGNTIGLAFAFLLTPLITFIIFKPPFLKDTKFNWSNKNFSFKDILSYGFKTSISNYASQLLFYLDVILIQRLTENTVSIADYRTATYIPFNLTFIASVYINNDYVHLVSKKSNPEYIINYLKKYFLLFGLITILIASLFYGFSDFIWQDLLFNGKFKDSQSIANTLMLATFAIILLRIPAGNILSAVGLVNINTIIAYLIIVFNILISYFLFLEYGLIGIAYGTVISLLVSGLAMMGYLFWHLRKK